MFAVAANSVHSFRIQFALACVMSVCYVCLPFVHICLRLFLVVVGVFLCQPRVSRCVCLPFSLDGAGAAPRAGLA